MIWKKLKALFGGEAEEAAVFRPEWIMLFFDCFSR